MVGLSQLWLPILLSGVIVFIASSIIHMVLPWHKGDYKRVPNEDRFREAVGALSIPPGDYMVPCPVRREDMRSKEFTDKMKAGPNMTMTVVPAGMPKMGTYMVQWFIFCVIVSVFAGYIAGRALPPGTEYLQVFRFAGVHRLFSGAVAELDLVPPIMADHVQTNGRWADLRHADRRRLRMAVAALSTRPWDER
jgi:hypothetical protein